MLGTIINGLRNLLFLGLLIVGLSGCTFSFSPDSGAALIPDDLEAQVLEIIRQNPEVLMETLQAFEQQRQQNQLQQQEQARQTIIDEIQGDPDAFIGDSPTKGSESNALMLIEFSDFQCPFCARAKRTTDQFMDAHGQDVKLVYKHLPLTQIHNQALPASKASWAAARQGEFWAFHDALFENQNRIGDELFIEVAQDLGLDMNRFNRDRNSRAAEQSVNRDLDYAQRLGIQGTPYFLLNGIPINGAQPLSAFEQALDQARLQLP